jgi:aryl-alcohol dehydrogenase-like predicted oxidoreductase
MKTIKIPEIDKPISVLGMGTMIFSPKKKDLCHSMLDVFVSNGGTLIDTAEIYGDPEEFGYSELTIGMWLGERRCREKIVLLSKGCIPNTCKPIHPDGLQISPKHIHAAIDGSLKRLNTDYIDIWLLHRDDMSLPVGPIIEALNEEVKRGRIKAFGGSNWTTSRIEEAKAFARSKGLQSFSVSSPHFCLALAKEPYWPGAVFTDGAAMRWYEKTGMPLFAWSSTGRGFFAKGDPSYLGDANLVRVYYNEDNFEKLRRAEKVGKAKGLTRIEVSLAYLANQKFPVVPLVGPETDEQVKSCAKAMGTFLTKREMEYLELKVDSY